MVDYAAERCLQSLQSVNKELLKISESTVLSLPMLKNVSRSVKAEWLDQEEIVEVFRHNVSEYLKEKISALSQTPSAPTKYQEYDGLPVEKLNERKSFMDEEFKKIKEEQALIDSAISMSLDKLEKIQISDI